MNSNEGQSMEYTKELRQRLFAPITAEELAALPLRASIGRYKANLAWGGWCPICGRHDGLLNIESVSYMACHAHKRVWPVGRNVVSGWKNEAESVWRGNYVQIHEYERCDEPGASTSTDWRLVENALMQAGMDVPLSFKDDHPSEFSWLVAQTGFCEPPEFGGAGRPATREECQADLRQFGGEILG